MEIQLIRDRLVKEISDLPGVTTPEIQSYALTSAVLVRRITEALNITDLRIQDAWEQQTSHDLARVLNKVVHYEDFSRALVKPPVGEQVRYDYVYLKSERSEPALVINLGSYFDHVRRFANDDVFVARYLLRRIDTLLSQVINQPGRGFDRHWLADVVDRMYDSFDLLGKLVRAGTLVVSPDQVIDGYPEDHGGRYIVPGPAVEHVPYGQMFADYGTPDGAAWHRSIVQVEKHRIGGSEVYMAAVLRTPTGAPYGEHVFFKLSDLLTMFKDLRQQIGTQPATKNSP